MLKNHSAIIALIVLLVVSLACSQTTPMAAPVQDPNTLNTSIAQTVAARQTEAALLNPPTATLTFTPETPTLTPEPVLSATPDFTATSETPLITVSKDTNCRVGPGAVYERVGILLTGEVAEVVGRDVTGEYWLIINPDGNTESCWVWGEYATVTGNTFTLLFPTTVPLPANAFTASVIGLKNCSDVWWVNFNLTNGSGVVFRSMSLNIQDEDGGATLSMVSDDFIVSGGCDTPVKRTEIALGLTIPVSSPPFGYDPSGHNITANIKVCTELNLGGTCLTQNLTFKP